MQGESEKDMIRTKADALAFLKSHKEFSDQDWIEGEFWFRYDRVKDPECLRHDYTINHETEGIIGVMESEAIDYVFRNRKRLNETDINPPAELGRLADASGDEQSTRIKTPAV